MGLLDRLNKSSEAEPQQKNDFEQYIDSHPNTPAGFLIYDTHPRTGKITDAFPWEGTAHGISGTVSPIESQGRVLVSELTDIGQAIEQGDVVKFVDESNPQAGGLVFSIDGEVKNEGGKEFHFMRRTDKEPTKVVTLTTRSKRTERSIWAA